MTMRFFSFLLLSAAATATVSAMDNGVGIKPAMGWNSWNHFQCNIDETTIRGTADILVSSGLRDAGYIYLNVDDCWQASARTATGEIIADPVKFPSGFAALAEYVHSKGLKFGLYSDAGSNTCGGRPGSRGHEKQDALTYAKWGVDYLKYDNCNAPASDWIIDRYTAMSDALNATGRPILFSLCEWGVKDPWTWAPKIGNSWRTAMDIGDNWDSMIRCLTDSVGLAQYAGPGAWNDPDMLEVGNGGMNFNEYQTHFAIWSIVKSPLLIGADIRAMSNETKSILMSTEVIALNQDPLGIAGDLVYQLGPHQVYAAPLADGSRGVILVNLHTVFTQYPAHNITVQFSWIGYTDTTIALVRDLYKQRDLGLHQGSFMGEVQPHGCLALRITPVLEEERDTMWRPWHATEAYYGKDKEEL